MSHLRLTIGISLIGILLSRGTASAEAPMATPIPAVQRDVPSVPVKKSYAGFKAGGWILSPIGCSLLIMGLVFRGPGFDSFPTQHAGVFPTAVYSPLLIGSYTLMGGGLMLGYGYGADHRHREALEWNRLSPADRLRIASDARNDLAGHRKSLVISGTLLGISAGLNLVAFAMRMVYAHVVFPKSPQTLTPESKAVASLEWVALGTSAILAVPTSVATGFHWARYRRDAALARQDPAAASRAMPVSLAPMISRDVFGLSASGSF